MNMNLELDPAIRADFDERGKYVDRRNRRVYQPNMYHRAVEEWVRKELPCPRCGVIALEEPRRRRKSWRDFVNLACCSCGREYLLLKRCIPMRDTAPCPIYRALIERVEAGDAPDVICVACDRDAYQISDVFVVPGCMLDPAFISPGVQPDPTADYDTWSNILIGRMVHELGKEAVVDIVTREGIVSPQEAQTRLGAADESARKRKETNNGNR